jgi:hypothetical protein
MGLDYCLRPFYVCCRMKKPYSQLDKFRCRVLQIIKLYQLAGPNVREGVDSARHVICDPFTHRISA